jgi:DNA-binding transcriptional LysR family regulator
MDLNRLRHIVAVARNQSFSRAAEELGITQPALSRSIAAFERRHDVVLFDRGRGGVHPTAAGNLVIDQARKLLAAAGDLERSLSRYPAGEVARIAFGLGPLLAALMLPRLAASLLRAFPGIEIVAPVRTPDQLIADLLADRIEMILGNNWNLGRVPGTDLERLGKLKLAVIARAGHPLAAAGRVSAAQLEAYPSAGAVEFPAGGPSGAGGLVCDNFHVLRETVVQSDCLWISSPAFVAAQLGDGTMVELDVAGLSLAESDVCVVAKRGRTRSPAMMAVMAEVRDLLREPPREP